MRFVKPALVTLALVGLSLTAGILLDPHARAAVSGYLQSGRDCWRGERLLQFSQFENLGYTTEGGISFLVRREGIEVEYHGCLRSSPCAAYSRAYTRMTRFVLSLDYGYDILDQLEDLGRHGGITVRVSHEAR